jgi:amino acid transporter
MLTLGLGLTQLAKLMPSSGGYYTYVSRTVGARAGFLTAWLFFLYSALSPAFSLAMMGAVLESGLQAEYSITFPWWLFVVLATAFTFWATYRRIEMSAAALAVLGLLEVGIVVLLAGWGLVVPGAGGINLASFNPAHAPSGNGLYLGIVFSLYAMTGWEGVVPLGEESHNPRHVVSRAIVYTVLIMGVYLVFTSWGIVIGWGTHDLGALVRSKELPPFALARRYWGPGWIVIMFALLNSMLAIAVACSLVSTRMWYAMARARVLPAGLAAVHSRHQTPVNAVILQALVTLVGGLALGFSLGPEPAYYLMGTVVTLALAFIYSAGNLGVFLLYRGRGPEFRPVLHALFPLLSTVAVLWVAYKSVVPPPPGPIAYAPIIVGLWLTIGVMVLLVCKGLGRERWLLGIEAAARDSAAEVASNRR